MTLSHKIINKLIILRVGFRMGGCNIRKKIYVSNIIDTYTQYIQQQIRILLNVSAYLNILKKMFEGMPLY